MSLFFIILKIVLMINYYFFFSFPNSRLTGRGQVPQQAEAVIANGPKSTRCTAWEEGKLTSSAVPVFR
jgi:hypothetical protein